MDVLSGGRVDWGIGAGWVAAEYEKVGIEFDRGSVRVDRLCEAVAVMKGLFADGAFSFAGHHYRVHELDGRPKPIQRPHPPLLIGGAGRRVLSFAAREADIVGIGPSLSSRRLGQFPPRQSVEAAVDEQLGWIRIAATQRAGDLELQMVASPIVVTADPTTTARRIADRAGLTPDESVAFAARMGRINRRDLRQTRTSPRPLGHLILDRSRKRITRSHTRHRTTRRDLTVSLHPVREAARDSCDYDAAAPRRSRSRSGRPHAARRCRRSRRVPHRGCNPRRCGRRRGG